MSLLARLIPKGPPAWDADARETARAAGVTASVVLVTWNRLRMLEPCVRGLMANAGDVDYELIVWDNASDDGTAEFLDALAGEDPRVRVVHSVENVGLNGVAAGVSLARGDYIVELDDDVLEFPEEWLSRMIAAFDAVPRAGYLAANVVQDGITNGAKPPADAYRARTYRGGVVIEHGPTGGWCAITSRAVVEPPLPRRHRARRARLPRLWSHGERRLRLPGAVPHEVRGRRGVPPHARRHPGCDGGPSPGVRR
jgi:glycosyltransferase involved in cell wall biosynthesis